MSEITLEKIDIVRERTGVTYSNAKEALEICEGNVVDAIIYLEKNAKSTMQDIYTTKDEFISWIKDVVNKGNVARIKVKKDEKVIVDIPVTAGIAAGLFALIWPPLIAIGALTAVVTKVTVEITKNDGTVEVVNKTIKTTMQDVKDKVTDVANEVKDKFTHKKDTENKENANVYQYTVKFEELDDEEQK